MQPDFFFVYEKFLFVALYCVLLTTCHGGRSVQSVAKVDFFSFRDPDLN